jgi:hypothetical protein
MSDKFIITFMDIRNGNPADEDNQVTNFFTVRQWWIPKSPKLTVTGGQVGEEANEHL